MPTLYGRWTEEALQSYRLIQDETADAVVAEFEKSGDPKDVTRMFQTLITNKDIDAIKDPGLKKYFQDNSRLPDWADPVKMKRAQGIFAQHGLMVSSLLMFRSLPLCYACGNGAHILWLTGRLDYSGGSSNPMARRIMETAQFVVDTHAPDAFAPGKSGMATALKVRLVHATVRYMIHKKLASGWDEGVWGEKVNLTEIGMPINQEDLAGTLMSFSSAILSGLDRMGTVLSPQDQAAWIHNLNVVGYLIGIKKELLPLDAKDAHELTLSILKHQSRVSPAGRDLTSALGTFMHSMMPGNTFDCFSDFMLNHMMQDYEDWLKLPLRSMLALPPHESLRDRLMLRVGTIGEKVATDLGDHSTIAQSLIGKFNAHLMQAMINHFNDGKRVTFQVPEELRTAWHLDENTAPKTVLATPTILGYRLAIEKK